MQELVNRFAEAYVNMAEQANYRPAAPGDGCGGISLSDEELRDPQQLKREASEYALRFMKEEEQHRFVTGGSNFTTNRALVYVIEAARLLCGGTDFSPSMLSALALRIN